MDPLVGAGLAAAKAAAENSEASKGAWSLIGRVLGPAADEYGSHLAEKVATWRADNAQRIAEKAAKKASRREGTVPPRVAYKILDEGTLTDDDVAVEYLSGLLAGSRTPSGKDDRALVWSDLVSRMSSLQIRAHYLLYREWALGLPGSNTLNLGVATTRGRAELHTPMDPFMHALALADDPAISGDALIALASHSIPGLARLGLIEDDFQFGWRSTDEESPFDPYIRVRPTIAGLEFYAAAAGVQVLPADWPDARLSVEVDPPLPRLHEVAFPRLAS